MAQEILPYVYFKGAIIPRDEAHVSIACNSLQYGSTCFAGIRGYIHSGEVKVFRLYDHYQRLMNGVKILALDYHISYDAFRDLIASLVLKNNPQSDFYIRPFVFAADEQLAPKPIGLNFDLAIYLVPLGSYLASENGVRLMISSWRKFADTALSSKGKIGGCYVNSFLATSEALRSGYDEALLLDSEGYIAEASVANLLLVYRNELLRVEVGAPVLEGITLRSVVELLERENKYVAQRRIDRSTIYCCDEVILLGTAVQAAFVSSIDGRTIGTGTPGPLFNWIKEKFSDLRNGRDPIAAEWFSQFPLPSS